MITRMPNSRLANADNLVIGGRRAAAAFAHKPLITVRRYCVPIACDVNTRADLYDLQAVVGQLQAMSAGRCCITDGHGDPCGSTVMTNSPQPICAFHAAAISEFFLKQDRVELMRQAALARQAAAPPRLPDLVPRASVVYYVQVDAAIKIGTSTDIARRMRDYPPHARLLCTEPGGFTLEAKRHRQFNEYLRSGKEWFHPGPRLRTHIDALMAVEDTPISASA
jgi:hypothetical protein